MTAPDEAVLARYWRLQDEAIAACPPYPAGRFDGQGIVIPAGGPRYFTCAWVCINVLREVLQCTLPIEVWYLGSGEMSRKMIELLEPLGVECVDALESVDDSAGRILNGWELKPYAIIHSRFQEILYIDADNVPVVDPSVLLSCVEYRTSGALFWPDIFQLGPNHPIWTICRIPYCDEPAVETGQIVIDKLRCWEPIHLTMHLNEHSDFYYPYTRGGAETFHLAWRMLDSSYVLIPHPTRKVEGMLLQHDVQGRPLFQHRIDPKWVAWGENARIPGFVHEEQCLDLLRRLRERWDGSVAVPDPRERARGSTAEEEIIRTSRYLYCRVGSDQRVLELLSDHRIGMGRATCECGWYMSADGNEPRLVIEGSGEDGYFGAICRLARDETGVWRGTWLQYEKMPVELIPLGQQRRMPEDDRDYVNKVIDHTTADARRVPGMRAKGLAPDEAGVNPDDVVVTYDRLWGQMRVARDGRDESGLYFALRSLLMRYGNDADLLRERLQGESVSGADMSDVVDGALSGNWYPAPPVSQPSRAILRGLRRK